MYLRIIAAFALSFVFYVASGQEAYHRLYETTIDDPTGMTDTIFYHHCSATISGDVMAMGTKRVINSDMSTEDLTVIITKHDHKGNVSWSKELDFGQDTVKIVGIGKIEYNGAKDSILFTIDVEINDELTQLFGRFDNGGNDLDLRAVRGYEATPNLTGAELSAFVNNSDLLYTPTPTNRAIISRIGFEDELLWSRNYDFNNSADESKLDFIADMETTKDTTIVITGLGTGTVGEFVLAELDSNGVQLWAEAYTFTGTDLGAIFPMEVAPLANGDLAVAGFYLNSTLQESNGFVAIVDTAGSVVMAQKLYNSENTTSITNLREGADGTLWITGMYTNEAQDTILYYTSNLNIDGTENWTSIYPEEVTNSDPFITSLLNVDATGGTTFVGHGFIDDLAVMRVIRHDAAGSALCSVNGTLMIEPLTMAEDTLTSTVTNGGLFFDSIGYELTTFSDFQPPVLTVDQLPTYCMNEFVDTFIVASVSGVEKENLSYMWNTGATSDTLFVVLQPTEMPEFSVTVTVAEDVCYKMCDTIQVQRIPLPGVSLSQQCDGQLVRITATFNPGATGPMFLWSTGETSETIEVTVDGNYSVTVTDDCGEMASANVDVDIPDPLSVQIFESVTYDIFCDNDNSYKLSAAPTGGRQAFSYIWSTGEAGGDIFVNEDGNYSVTVTDACGNTAMNSIDVTIVHSAPTSGEITYELQCEDDPALSRVIFNANLDTDNPENAIARFFVQREVDGEFGEGMIMEIPTEPLLLGTYRVILQACDELDEVTINAEALCGDVFHFPIVFFPGGMDEMNQTFGPVTRDTMYAMDNVSDVEFKVFNRWGETVFESNDVFDAWDGSHKNEPAPSEVYIWYITYMLEGEEKVQKGNVTLIR